MENKEATQFFRDCHKQLFGLFRQFENIGARAPEMMTGVKGEIVMQLEIYSRLQRELWYPKLSELIPVENSELGGLLDQGERTLHDLAPLMESVKNFKPEGAEFRSRYEDLASNTENYFMFEETELFPEIEKNFTQGFDGLVSRLESRKQELLALPEYRSVLPEVVQNPGGGEQKRKPAA